MPAFVPCPTCQQPASIVDGRIVCHRCHPASPSVPVNRGPIVAPREPVLTSRQKQPSMAPVLWLLGVIAFLLLVITVVALSFEYRAQRAEEQLQRQRDAIERLIPHQ